MKKILEFSLYFLLFLFFIVFTLPKENIYFLLEKNLENKDIIINEKEINDSFLALKLLKAELFYKKEKLLKANSANFLLSPFYSSLEVQNISFYFEKKFISILDKLLLDYSILNPLNINISANGSLGEIEGKVVLSKFLLEVKIKPTRESKSKFKKYFSSMKYENGVYYYEYKF